MNKVLFSFRKETVNTGGTTLPDKAELFDNLRERNLDPVVSLDAESAFDDHGVDVHELVGEDQTTGLGHAALSDVAVIVNRLDRSFRWEEAVGTKGSILPALPDAWQAAAKPTINENEMRSLAFRKARVQSEILEPLGLGLPTKQLQSVEDIALFAHENPSSLYVVKPNSGSGSKNVYVVSAEQAMAQLVTTVAETDMIIQPYYDFTRPFDTSIKPYDTLSNEAFEGWSKSETVKEFRMYAFYGPHTRLLFPVARAMEDRVDHWFFVDPESIPEKVYADTEQVIMKAAESVGSRAVYAALDFGYGGPDGQKPDYHIVELNGKMPYLIGSDKHKGVASTLRQHFADQLKDVADSESKLQ